MKNYETMSKGEFKDLKAGDKVMVIPKYNVRPDNWASDMDKYLGKTLTVIEMTDAYNIIPRIRVEENMWHWNYFHLLSKRYTKKLKKSETKKPYKTFNIKVTVNPPATIVQMPNGERFVTKCHPDDEFNEYEGIKKALAKAYNNKKEETKETSEPYSFNGKAICIKSVSDSFEVGKIYEFINGKYNGCGIYSLNNPNYPENTLENLIMPFLNGNTIFVAIKE